MDDFHWHTDDESGWGQSAEAEPPAPTGRARHWLTSGLLGLFVVAALLFNVQQRRDTVAALVAGAEDDAVAAFRLLYDAARRGDAELFTSFLSGAAPDWALAQQNAVAAGAFLARDAARLTSSDAPPAVTVTSVSSDLLTTELTAALTYTVPAAGHAVTLDHPFVMRRSADRWLLAPPGADWWGPTATVSGPWLVVTYPARDAAVVGPLHAAVEALLAEQCPQVAGGCPAAPLHITLTTDPADLATLLQPHEALGAIECAFAACVIVPRRRLPTPTLVGVPQDADGFAWLVDAYARPVLLAAVAPALQPVYGSSAGLYAAAVAAATPDVDWPARQLDAAWFSRLLATKTHLADLALDWNHSRLDTFTTAELQPFYAAVVAFLLATYPELDTATLQASLMAPPDNVHSWLVGLYLRTAAGQSAESPPQRLMSRLESDWQDFLVARAVRPGPPPVPFPAQDVVVGCQNGGHPTLSRLDLATLTWHDEFRQSGGSITAFSQLPDARGVWLSTSAGSSGPTTLLWQPDEALPLPLGDGEAVFFGQANPTGDRLVVAARQTRIGVYDLGVLDVDACRAGACARAPLPGMPFWSPDGARTVVIATDSIGSAYPSDAVGAVYLADARGEQRRRLGTTATVDAFWLDAQTFGFVQHDGPGAQTIMIGTGADDLTPLVSLAPLAGYLAASGVRDPVTIYNVEPDPLNPDRLLILVGTLSGARVSALFRYDRADDALTHLFLAAGQWGRLQYSADNTHLYMRAFGPYDQFRHDIARGTTVRLDDNRYAQPFGWSTDGNWLLMNEFDDRIALLAPAHDYAVRLHINRQDCLAAVFVADK